MAALSRKYLEAIRHHGLTQEVGQVVECVGTLVTAKGLKLSIGDFCKISNANRSPLYGTKSGTNDIHSGDSGETEAQVVGIRGEDILLMPFKLLSGISSGSLVYSRNKFRRVKVGEGLKGRVLNAFGEPVDGKGALKDSLSCDESYPVDFTPIDPSEREPITEVYHTGIRAIDALLTMGRGQRMGVFAGSGVGKTSLLRMIASNDDSDVHIMALIGERGREVEEFVEYVQSSHQRDKYIVVSATSDQPAMLRRQAVYTATAIAEYFKDKGNNVLLTVDSLTRIASAQREIGLAVGEPPTVRGYTPSVFAMMPPILERAGNYKGKGSITAFYAVLMEGDESSDPLVDNVRSILDGHIVLSRRLNKEAHYPPIDVLESKSRLATKLQGERHAHTVSLLQKYLTHYDHNREIIEMGIYEKGSSEEVDKVISLLPKINEFLKQAHNTQHDKNGLLKQLEDLVAL